MTTDSSATKSAFPSTSRSWIDERLGAGVAGRAEVNRYVMLVYSTPLERYVARTAYRGLGEPADLVAGFFADRLERETFLPDWKGSGKRLRHWLCNALLYYLKETARQRTRDARYRELAFEIPDEEPSPDEAFDHDFALSVVQVALQETRAHLVEQGRAQHFEIFFAHHSRGVSYPDLAREHGLSPARARVMGRTGRETFRRRLRRLVKSDGVRKDVDGEIDELLEGLL